jgi:hypothetical protein
VREHGEHAGTRSERLADRGHIGQLPDQERALATTRRMLDGRLHVGARQGQRSPQARCCRADQDLSAQRRRRLGNEQSTRVAGHPDRIKAIEQLGGQPIQRRDDDAGAASFVERIPSRVAARGQRGMQSRRLQRGRTQRIDDLGTRRGLRSVAAGLDQRGSEDAGKIADTARVLGICERPDRRAVARPADVGAAVRDRQRGGRRVFPPPLQPAPHPQRFHHGVASGASAWIARPERATSETPRSATPRSCG